VITPRQELILRKVVEAYNAGGQPVGSKTLSADPELEFGPSTIRNELAMLEEQGLLAHPHTSAGRVPTDKGYRLFVDRLSTVKPLTGAERRAIQSFLDGAVDLDDIVGRTVRLLAQLTRQVAVVQYPSLSRSQVRHLELVPLTSSRLMLVLITDTGRVEQRVVELPGPVSAESVAELRGTLNSRLRDHALADAPMIIDELPGEVAPELRGLLATLTSVLLETLVEQHSDRIVLGGTANLTEHALDFPAIRPVLEALEEQVVLLRLLDQSVATSSVVVRIGNENQHEALTGTSVVTSGYGMRGASLGAVGVLGPRRMDYAHTMARVAAVARYVGELLAER